MAFFFMRQGHGQIWLDECLSNGVLKLAFILTDPALVDADDWDGVKEQWRQFRANSDAGNPNPVAAQDLAEIRRFYGLSQNDIVITNRRIGTGQYEFFWCRPQGSVWRELDKTDPVLKEWNLTGDEAEKLGYAHHYLQTVDGWHALKPDQRPVSNDNEARDMTFQMIRFQRTIRLLRPEHYIFDEKAFG